MRFVLRYRSQWMASAAVKLCSGGAPANGAAEAAPAAGAAPSSKRAMDYDQALSQVGGDESLLQRMIGQFVECTAKACTRMDGFVEKSEWESLRLEAHSLKGHLETEVRQARGRASAAEYLASAASWVADHLDGGLETASTDAMRLYESLGAYPLFELPGALPP